MLGLLIGGAVVLGMVAIGLTLATIGLVLRGVFWLILLPFKMLFGVLSLALFLPLILISTALLVMCVLFAVLTPLVPFLLLAVVVWGSVRVFERPARVRA
jgi:hypothetical protein